MSTWILEAPFLFLATVLSSKDGALISIPQGAGARDVLCIHPDWPSGGFLLMAANILNAEAAGQCFGGLALNGSPAREKERWSVSQTHSQALMDGGSGATPPSLEIPLRLMCAGCEQVQKDSAGETRLGLSPAHPFGSSTPKPGLVLPSLHCE